MITRDMKVTFATVFTIGLFVSSAIAEKPKAIDVAVRLRSTMMSEKNTGR